jgi:CRP-like cAMP-binding protein
MEKPRPPRTVPPDLPGADSCEVWLDHTLALLLANETEAALRWGAAVVGRDGSPSALIFTSRLLEQMGRGRAAAEGLRMAVESAVDAGNVPLAMAAIHDLRVLGVDVGEHLDRLAITFCRGAARLDETQALPLVPHLEDLQPLSSFLTGPALASMATQILRGAAAAREETPVEPPRIGPLPLFSALGPQALRDLLEALEVITVPAGHRVLSEGERGTAAYILARGEVEVTRRQQPYGVSIVVARLQAGAFLGERVLLSDLPCAASVVAVRPSILLMARRESLQAVAARHPEVARELAAHCRRQLVANLGRPAPVLATLPAKERGVLIEQFETHTFEKGEKVLIDGEEASGLHLVAAGEVAIVARDGGERVILATVGAGETLGEMELVLCRRASADAIAVRPTTTLFLPRGQFLALAAEHPAIAHRLYMVALRRHAETAQAMDAPAALADGDLLEDPGSKALPREAPHVAEPVATRFSVSRPSASKRGRSLVLPALIGAGAFVGAGGIPVVLALLLGRHRDGFSANALSALEARNVAVPTETAIPSETMPEAESPRPPATPILMSKRAAWSHKARASAVSPPPASSVAVPSPDPLPVSASPEAGAVDPRNDEFGGRE